MKVQDLNERTKKLELELISSLIFDEKKIKPVAKSIKADELFYFRQAFETLLDCHLNEKNPAIEFSAKGLKLADYLAEQSFRNIDTICRDIREISNTRKVWSVLEDAVQGIKTDDIFAYVSEVQKKLLTSIEKPDFEKTDIESVIREYRTRQDFYRQKFASGGGIIGQSTGYGKLDQVIDGLRPEHLWIIGGYTNTGKTAASLNIAAKLIRDGKRVVYYSLEMGQIDILARLIGIMAGEGGTDILKGFGKDRDKEAEAIDQIVKSNFSVQTFHSELSELLFSMLEENSRQPVDLFIVDFIQLITVKGAKSEYETITATTLELQKAAKRFKTPILVLSQISNEGARNGESPVMSFKGSGAIAAAADLAIEIKSGEDNKEDLKQKLKDGTDVLMKWDVRKNRHGRVGTIDMLFNGRTGVFKQLEPDQVKQVENRNFGSWGD